jgi:hypothetical protein
MSEPKVDPQRVTKPIQLLAAWLVGLTAVNGMFLSTAVALQGGGWERLALVLAAILNVPAFLAAIFVLQTKFRAELQEDSFYFKYISKKEDSIVSVNRLGIIEERLEIINKKINSISSETSIGLDGTILEAAGWSEWRVALNDHREDFKEIRAALKEAGIPLTTVFGGCNGSPQPSKWIISFNQDLNLELVAEVLKALSPFRFDGFQLWRPIPEAGEDEDVYIGSYGEWTGFIPIDEALNRILAKNYDEIDFKIFLGRSRAAA